MAGPKNITKFRMANAFLSNYGEAIHSFNEMNPIGDLVAIVDLDVSGFYAFVTRGINPSRKREGISLFNQSLEEASSLEGSVSEIEFGLPDKYYIADVVSTEMLKKDSEHWIRGEKGIYVKIVPRISLDTGLIYRITAKDLIKKIKGVYNNPGLEVKSNN